MRLVKDMIDLRKRLNSDVIKYQLLLINRFFFEHTVEPVWQQAESPWSRVPLYDSSIQLCITKVFSPGGIEIPL